MFKQAIECLFFIGIGDTAIHDLARVLVVFADGGKHPIQIGVKVVGLPFAIHIAAYDDKASQA